MSLILFVGTVIGLASLYGAAYLLSLWHEDRAERRAGNEVAIAHGAPDPGDGWPLSRVLAYLAIASTLASNYLLIPTALRLVDFPNFRDIVALLTPFTIAALIVLDCLFTILALYLRAIRGRHSKGREIHYEHAVPRMSHTETEPPETGVGSDPMS